MRAREKADAFFRFLNGPRSASEHPPEFPWGCEQAASNYLSSSRWCDRFSWHTTGPILEAYIRIEAANAALLGNDILLLKLVRDAQDKLRGKG